MWDNNLLKSHYSLDMCSGATSKTDLGFSSVWTMLEMPASWTNLPPIITHWKDMRLWPLHGHMHLLTVLDWWPRISSRGIIAEDLSLALASWVAIPIPFHFSPHKRWNESGCHRRRCISTFLLEIAVWWVRNAGHCKLSVPHSDARLEVAILGCWKAYDALKYYGAYFGKFIYYWHNCPLVWKCSDFVWCRGTL